MIAQPFDLQAARFLEFIMGKVKKTLRFFMSMKFAVILLVILAAVCAAASFITQNQTYEWYSAVYNERAAALILAFHLDDAFHSWWFILITAFLVLNLLSCNLVRLSGLIRRYKRENDPEKAVFPASAPTAVIQGDPSAAFEKLGMKNTSSGTTEDGKKYVFASKNRAGLWGAWICHLGIMLIILGFGLGQMTKETYAVYGVPGQTKLLGDTSLAVTIDDFSIDLREDDTVKQYIADITVTDLSSVSDRQADKESAEISVNHPAKLFGYTFYQNSTGWAGTLRACKDAALLQETVLLAGEYTEIEDRPGLVVYFNAFYPDYVLTDQGPSTKTGSLKNPAYLYSIYYNGEMVGMNALMQDEEIKIDEYVVTFSDPQNYTVLQVKKDDFTFLALIGGLITAIGLFLAFYLVPAKAMAIENEDGTFIMKGASEKGGALFRDKFMKLQED